MMSLGLEGTRAVVIQYHLTGKVHSLVPSLATGRVLSQRHSLYFAIENCLGCKMGGMARA